MNPLHPLIVSTSSLKQRDLEPVLSNQLQLLEPIFKKIKETTFLEKPICNDFGLVINEDLICNCNYLGNCLSEKSVELLRAFKQTILFEKVTLKQLIDTQQKLYNTKAYLFGGFAIHVFEHSLANILEKLTLTHLCADFSPSYRFADKDIYFQCPQLTKELIFNYLQICKNTNYEINKFDVSLASSFHTIFKKYYEEIYQKPLTFHILENPETNSQYLHLSIKDIDISYSFMKRNELFTINSLEIDLTNDRFVSSTNNLIQSIIDLIINNLRIVNIEACNAKSFLKVLLNLTKKFRCLNANDIRELEDKSIKKLKSYCATSFFPLLKDLKDKHSTDQEYFFPAFICLYTTLSNDNKFFATNALKEFPSAVNENSLYSSLVNFSGSFENYYTLLSFTILLTTISPKETTFVTTITHLNQTYFRVEYKPFNDSQEKSYFFLPGNKEQIIKEWEDLFKVDFSTNILTTLQFLLECFTSLTSTLSIDENMSEIGKKIESLGFALFEKDDYTSYFLGYYTLMICNSKISALNLSTINKIITILASKTGNNKNDLIQKTLSNCSFFKHIDKTHWLNTVLNEYEDIYFGIVEYLKEMDDYKNLNMALKENILESYEQKLYSFYVFLMEKCPKSVEKKFVSLLKENISTRLLVDIYENFKNPSLSLKTNFTTFYVEKLEYTSPFYSINCSIVIQLIQENLKKAIIVWKKIKQNNGFDLRSSSYENCLRQLQTAFITKHTPLFFQEKFAKLDKTITNTIKNGLWDNIVTQEFYPFITQFIEGKPDEAENLFSHLQKNSFLNSHAETTQNIPILLELFALAETRKGYFVDKKISNYSPIDTLLIKAIRKFKSNLDKPFFESFLLKKLLSVIDFKKIHDDTLTLITSFIFYFKKDPKTILPLVEHLRNNDILEFLTHVLPLVAIDITPLIKKIALQDENQKGKMIPILEFYYEQIVKNLRVVSDFDLFFIIESFLKVSISSSLIQTVLEKLLKSKDSSLLKKVLTVIQQKNMSNSFNEAHLLDALKAILEYDTTFVLDYLSKINFKNCLSLFLSIKENNGVEAFYQELKTHQLFHKYLLFDNDSERLFIDLNCLENSSIVLEIIELKIEPLIKETNLESLVNFFIDFYKQIANGRNVSLLRKIIINKFKVLSNRLKEENLLILWIQLVALIGNELFEKYSSFYQKMIVSCFEDCFNDDLISLFETLPFGKIQIQEPLESQEVLWNKDNLIKIYSQILRKITLKSDKILKAYVNVCLQLKLSGYTFEKEPENILLENDAPVIAIIFFACSTPFKNLNQEKALLLNNIMAKLVEDKQNCLKVCSSFFSEETPFYHLGFPLEVINKNLLILFLDHVVSLNPHLGLQFMITINKVSFKSYKKLLKTNLSNESVYKIIEIAERNNIYASNFLENFYLLKECVRKDYSLAIYIKIANLLSTLVILLGKDIFVSIEEEYKETIQELFSYILEFSAFEIQAQLMPIFVVWLQCFKIFEHTDVEFAYFNEWKLTAKLLTIKNQNDLFTILSKKLKNNSIQTHSYYYITCLEEIINYGLELQLNKNLNVKNLLIDLCDIYLQCVPQEFGINLLNCGFFCEEDVVEKIFFMLEKFLKGTTSEYFNLENNSNIENSIAIFICTYIKNFIAIYGSDTSFIKVFIEPLSLGYKDKIFYCFEKIKNKEYVPCQETDIDTLKLYNNLFSSLKDVNEGVKQAIFLKAILDLRLVSKNSDTFLENSLKLLCSICHEDPTLIETWLKDINSQYESYLKKTKETTKIYFDYAVSTDKHSKLKHYGNITHVSIYSKIEKRSSAFKIYLQILLEAYLHLPSCNEKDLYIIKFLFLFLKNNFVSHTFPELLLKFNLSHLPLTTTYPYFEYVGIQSFCKYCLEKLESDYLVPSYFLKALNISLHQKELKNTIDEKLGYEYYFYHVEQALQFAVKQDFRQSALLAVINKSFYESSTNPEFLTYFFKKALDNLTNLFDKFLLAIDSKEKRLLLELPIATLIIIEASTPVKDLLFFYSDFLFQSLSKCHNEEQKGTLLIAFATTFINYFDHKNKMKINKITYKYMFEKFYALAIKIMQDNIIFSKKTLLAFDRLNKLLSQNEQKFRLSDFMEKRKEMFDLLAKKN